MAKKNVQSFITFNRREAMGSPLGLWWFAPVLSGGGYGSEATALLQGLHMALESPVAVRATHHGDAKDFEHFLGLPSTIREALEATLRASTPAAEDAVVVCHSEPGAWYPALYDTPRCPPAGAAVAIGRTMFETDRLDPAHVIRCNAMREIWVPTEWGAETFAKSGVRREKIRVVPEAVAVDRFDANAVAGSPRFDLEARARHVLGPPSREDGVKTVTKFLSVFKWEARKAPEVLLRAYLDEFTAEDDVALFLRCDLYHETLEKNQEDPVVERIEAFAWSGKRRPEKRETEKSTQNFPRVYVLPRIPDIEMPSVYAAADAFVLPSRGEGWGRPHVEAMSLGLPVIATNWSGPTAFMTERNSYLLAIEEELVSLPSDSHWNAHKWAQPRVDHLRQLMRRVHESPEEAKSRGKQAAEDMRRRFAPETVARDVLMHVNRLAEELREESERRKNFEL
jgi:glycosyltransferase involved in cell wall biosynthesis